MSCRPGRRSSSLGGREGQLCQDFLALEATPSSLSKGDEVQMLCDLNVACLAWHVVRHVRPGLLC